MIIPDFREFVGPTDVIHSPKGTTWKNHKYIKKINDRYVYEKEKWKKRKEDEELLDYYGEKERRAGKSDEIDSHREWAEEKRKEYMTQSYKERGLRWLDENLELLQTKLNSGIDDVQRFIDKETQNTKRRKEDAGYIWYGENRVAKQIKKENLPAKKVVRDEYIREQHKADKIYKVKQEARKKQNNRNRGY